MGEGCRDRSRDRLRADIPFSLSRRLYINYTGGDRGVGATTPRVSSTTNDEGGSLVRAWKFCTPRCTESSPIDRPLFRCCRGSRKREGEGGTRYIASREPRNGRPLRKQFNIRAREKKREEGKEWREESTETLLGLMKRVLIRDTFLGGWFWASWKGNFFCGLGRRIVFFPFFLLVYFILLSICWKGGEKGDVKYLEEFGVTTVKGPFNNSNSDIFRSWRFPNNAAKQFCDKA